jgi:short-subunit dehydrogenase
MKPAVEFRGAWALVTGASSGIGEVFAKKLAERGSNLVLAARSREKLQRLRDDLSRVNGVEVLAVAVDLATPDGPKELLDRILATGSFIEHVVNNAGFGSAGPFVALDPFREASMVRLNADAVVVLTRGLLEPMVRAGRGGFINVSSVAGFQATPYMATYGATKAFVTSFSLALSAELRGSGVRMMALCPGPVPTGFRDAAGISGPVVALAELSAERTVERGLAAYERGKVLCVPGFVNGAQTLASKLFPRELVTWATVRAMRRGGRTREAPGG